MQSLLLVIALILLGGCTSQSVKESAPKTTDASSAAVDASAEAEVSAVNASIAESKVPKRPRPSDYPVAPFPKDALYQLLVAEVAGYRGEYSTALEKYVDMALKTRDAGVAQRAAMLAVYLKRYEEALTTSKIWVEQEPDSIEARRYLSEQLLRIGDMEQAIVHMEAIKNLGGLANFESFAYSAANMDDKGREVLLEAMSRMLAEYPGDEQLMFSKAVLLEQSGQLEEALQLANQLLVSKKDINVIVLKVNALKDLLRTDEALVFLESTLEELADKRRLRLIYARMLFEAERLVDAEKQYEQVHQQAPNDSDILFALALISMEQGKDESAKGYLNQMIRFNRRANEAHYYLGSIADKNDKIPQAISEYKMVGPGREYLAAQVRIAALLADQDRLDDARAHLENQRANNPDRYNRLVMIEGQLLSERGHEAEFFELLEMVIQKQPENVELLYFRAMTGQSLGRLDVLEQDLLRVIEIDPGNADAMNALGYTLADQTDRHDEALVLIERALEIKPNEAAFIDSLGWVQYRLENYKDAVTNLRKALSLFDNDEVAAHLGEVLWVSGEQQEARNVWQKALDARPDSDILKRVIKRFVAP
ncbi:tetratricopeptide repeat protein [Pseudomonadales bacterium]|nr:tetratricopeptide repeat protein [Pseudomonadales bacterium]MDC1017685.1 tetratricopeptide repeat protein [Pseudomonadales bacterium]MDC1479343.1 tetratricopeptide repeat protein [Pseudomonadales bacterium]